MQPNRLMGLDPRLLCATTTNNNANSSSPKTKHKPPVHLLNSPTRSHQLGSSLNSTSYQTVELEQSRLAYLKFWFYLCVTAAMVLVALWATNAAIQLYIENQKLALMRRNSVLEEAAQQVRLPQSPFIEVGETRGPPAGQNNDRLEERLHLLERYIEVIANDLQDAKSRLREREKCDCQMSCTFNGTRHLDGATWLSGCDTCSCQAGKITCSSSKCPKQTDCDSPVQLPGQCCPTCMKSCRHNGAPIKHGLKFRPAGEPKECRCNDGVIKCDPIRQSASQRLLVSSRKNQTKPSPARAGSTTIGPEMRDPLKPNGARATW